jgi:CspA family cold shock protein
MVHVVVGSLRSRLCEASSFEESEVPSTVTDGTIKRVISERGFGFIAAEDGKEYFFHRNELGESLDFDRLAGGEAVSFDVEASPKGPRAVRVQAAS